MTAIKEIAWALDVALINFLVGTVIFWELPKIGEATFSERVRRHEHHGHGYRRILATWICRQILRRLFDDGHC